jgi:DNA-binding response OmpR family regulator
MRILIVEDEDALRSGLVDLLEAEGHAVEAVADGAAAVDRGSDPAVDLILLDLMLPKLDGVEVCRRVRQLRPSVPILMLTAKGSEEDKVAGLGAGADDYVTKPFGVRELLARIEALTRRVQGAVGGEAQQADCDGCRIDFGLCEAERDGDSIRLTAREASILKLLYLNRERAVSRAEMLERVWEIRGDLQTRTVDMTVANLRHKIETDPKDPKIVVTVKGLGYAWGER